MSNSVEQLVVERLIDEAEGKPKWTNIQFDPSILSTYMSCPREMNLKYNAHLVPAGGISKSLEKGLLAHKGLACFYRLMKEGIDFTTRKTLALQEVRKFYPTFESLTPDELILILNTLEEYFEYRKNDVFKVVFTEKLFREVIYESFPLRIVLTGRIDLGVLDGNGSDILPIDHKTESESWFYSQTSNQFKVYALACNNQRLVVNRIGFQSSVKVEKKFKREELNFDKDVLDEFRHEVLPFYAKQMLISMEDNYYPPNYASCIRGHWGCVFSDKYLAGICTVSREVREQKLRANFIMKEWDPADEAND